MELASNPTLVMDWLSQPWHWSTSGAAIAGIVFLMTWMGKSFGISSSFESACSAVGASKLSNYFKRDLRKDGWRFAFVGGTILGGWIAANFLSSPEAVAISDATIASLAEHGYDYPAMDGRAAGFMPTELLNFTSLKGLALAIGGGFLVGFGARYSGGCTSGHSITGMSHLQLPSLITTIGFFIGGLLITHLVLPFIL